MSKETLDFLRHNIRYGFTDERGPAWWSAKSLDEDGNPEFMADGSHFAGPVPEEEVRRLFDVRLISGPLTTVFTTEDGERIPVVDKTRQTIIRDHRDGSGEVLGVFKEGYRIHGYNEWINDGMRAVTDSKLETACAALLRNGAVAFHQVKLPDTWEVQGVKFTPYFTGATSCDGSSSSVWFTGADAAVCDNTYEMARNGADTRTSRKHTKNSLDDIGEIRDRLGLVLKAGEDFVAMVEDLTNVEVSDADFALWLDEMAALPAPVKTKSGGPGRAYTIAENKRETLMQLWNHDPKVQPWAGTAFGILQLDNTYRTWERTVQGANRIERNLLNSVKGTSAAEDAKALATLKSVQERKLVIA